jgi:hypothetical protein
VLDAFLGAGHSEFGANPERLTQTRSNTSGCFPSLANYQAAFDPKVWNAKGTAGVSSKFTESSNYFRLTSFITIGSAEFNLYSLLYLDTPGPGGGGRGGAGGAVRPIQRSFTPD